MLRLKSIEGAALLAAPRVTNSPLFLDTLLSSLPQHPHGRLLHCVSVSALYRTPVMLG